jgi:hypothetical protein
MTSQVQSALVLQGGGALGAYELGAARALYKEKHFSPDLIAGVSIGAITAVILARPARGLKPLEALEAFWEKVSVPGLLFPPALRCYASFFGNANFFVPRANEATLAAKRTTSKIPIVMLSVFDPIGEGIVVSLAHPGGNVTGVMFIHGWINWSSLSGGCYSGRMEATGEEPHVGGRVFRGPAH